jgi:hypothetical protein
MRKMTGASLMKTLRMMLSCPALWRCDRLETVYSASAVQISAKVISCSVCNGSSRMKIGRDEMQRRGDVLQQAKQGETDAPGSGCKQHQRQRRHQCR